MSGTEMLLSLLLPLPRSNFVPARVEFLIIARVVYIASHTPTAGTFSCSRPSMPVPPSTIPPLSSTAEQLRR